MIKVIKNFFINLLILSLPTIYGFVKNKFFYSADIDYIISSFEALFMFYAFIYVADKIRIFSKKRSQYFDPYEKILTKERYDLFSKAITLMQLSASLFCLFIPLELNQYLNHDVPIIFYIFIFITSAIFELIYLKDFIRQNKELT